MGHERERLTEPHAVSHARAIDAGEAFMFETMRDFERLLGAAWAWRRGSLRVFVPL